MNKYFHEVVIEIFFEEYTIIRISRTLAENREAETFTFQILPMVIKQNHSANSFEEAKNKKIQKVKQGITKEGVLVEMGEVSREGLFLLQITRQ